MTAMICSALARTRTRKTSTTIQREVYTRRKVGRITIVTLFCDEAGSALQGRAANC